MWSNCKMISEQQIGDDVEGVGHVLIWDTMSAFAWRDWRKLRELNVRTKIWTWDLPSRSACLQRATFDVSFSDAFFHNNVLITGTEWEIKKKKTCDSGRGIFDPILSPFQGQTAIRTPNYCNLSRDFRSCLVKPVGFQAVELLHTSENSYYITKWWGHVWRVLIIHLKHSA